MSFIQLGGGGGGDFVSNDLLNGYIIIGDGSDRASAVVPSRQVSVSNTGVVTLVGVTDGVVAAAGAIGELISFGLDVPTTTGVGLTTAWGAVGSVALSAGSWRMISLVGVSENGAVIQNKIETALSTSATPLSITLLDTIVLPFQISGGGDVLTVGTTKYVDIAVPTTYHLNTRFDYTSGTPKHFGKIVAERIR